MNVYLIVRIADQRIVGASARDFQCATWDATIESTITQGDMNEAFGLVVKDYRDGLEGNGYRMALREVAL